MFLKRSDDIGSIEIANMRHSFSKAGTDKSSTSSSQLKIVRSISIMLVGDASVGKTSLISRYLKNYVEEDPPETIAIDFNTIVINLDGIHLKLEIWDSSGNPKYKRVSQLFNSKCEGIIICYDITSLKSFQNVLKWQKLMERNANSEFRLQYSVVGLKNDLESSRVVSFEMGQKMAIDLKGRFYEISSHSRLSFNIISMVFTDIAKAVFNEHVRVSSLNDKPESLHNHSRSRNPLKNKLSCCGTLISGRLLFCGRHAED